MFYFRVFVNCPGWKFDIDIALFVNQHETKPIFHDIDSIPSDFRC